jgi:hypothetical protein
MAYEVITNLLQYFEFASMVIFRRKNICGISTENYVLCSFGLKKDLIFRISAIRMDLRKKYDLCPISTSNENFIEIINFSKTLVHKVSEFALI